MYQKFLIVLYQNIEMLIALSAITQLFLYYDRKYPLPARIFKGILFGVVGILIMAYPYRLMDGITFDTRSILLSLIGLLYGAIPTFITFSMMLAFRIYIGGSGLTMGVLVIVSSTLIGFFWRRNVLPIKLRKNWFELYLLGLSVHLVMLLAMFALPSNIIGTTLMNIGIPVIIFYPIVTVLVGKVMSFQIVQIENLDTIQKAERKFRLLFQQAPIGISYSTAEGKFIEVNNEYAKMLGYTTSELKEKNFKDITYLADLESDIGNMKSLNEGIIDSFSMDKRYVRNDGSVIWTNLTVSKVQLSTDDQEYVMELILDITERKNAEILLEHLAFHDQTTNLFNRRYFEEYLERKDENLDTTMSMILVNVNSLKLINDAYGFKTGDLLLNKVANILTSSCVDSSIIARINSNEFIIVYNGANDKEITNKVSIIYDLIERETIENINISVSIGYASQGSMLINYHELFKVAESKMLTEKLIVKDSTISRTIEIIMNSLFEKNEREMLHSKRVSIICGKLARLMGMDEKSIEKIKIAGLMHDIGKIGVSDEVLNKKDKLTEYEWEQIKRHSDAGFRILSSANEFTQIADCVLTHHERWDGNGYPKGLKGEEIPLFSRIIAVADAFDAMTSKRSYREALERRHVVDEMKQNAGKQFDPNIVKIFMENFEEFVVI